MVKFIEDLDDEKVDIVYDWIMRSSVDDIVKLYNEAVQLYDFNEPWYLPVNEFKNWYKKLSADLKDEVDNAFVEIFDVNEPIEKFIDKVMQNPKYAYFESNPGFPALIEHGDTGLLSDALERVLTGEHNEEVLDYMVKKIKGTVKDTIENKVIPYGHSVDFHWEAIYNDGEMSSFDTTVDDFEIDYYYDTNTNLYTLGGVTAADHDHSASVPDELIEATPKFKSIDDMKEVVKELIEDNQLIDYTYYADNDAIEFYAKEEFAREYNYFIEKYSSVEIYQAN